jgi:hypothetical protein
MTITTIRRRAARIATVSVALGASLLAAAGTAATAAGPDASTIRQVDWRSVTLDLPDPTAACPGGPTTFAARTATKTRANGGVSTYYVGSEEIGDVNRDGIEDAVITVHCDPATLDGYKSFRTYAVKLVAGKPAIFATVLGDSVGSRSYTIGDGTVAVVADSPNSADPTVNLRLAWNGTRFVETSGKGVFARDWTHNALAMPFRAAAVPLLDLTGQPNSKSCPRITPDFVYAGGTNQRRTGSYVRDGFVYDVAAIRHGDLTRDGNLDVILNVSCSTVVGHHSASWYYVYTVRPDGTPALVSYLTANNYAGGVTQVHEIDIVDGGVRVFQAGNGTPIYRNFRWSGSRFTVDVPLPGHPGADVAP